MPRPRHPGAPEPKRRSRKGCWPCKARKIKCGEERPACRSCLKTGDKCDYNLRLNWEGRRATQTVSLGGDADLPASPREDLDCHVSDQAFLGTGVLEPQSSSAATHQSTRVPEPLRYEFRQLHFGENSSSLARRKLSAVSRRKQKRRSTDEGDYKSTLKYKSQRILTDAAPYEKPLNSRHLIDSQASTPASPSQVGSSWMPSSPDGRMRSKSLADFGELDLSRMLSLYCPRQPASPSPSVASFASYPTMADSPLTSGGASSYSDDALYNTNWQEQIAPGSPDQQSSLYSNMITSANTPLHGWETSTIHSDVESMLDTGAMDWEPGKFHGYDLGLPDGDLLENDDANALSRINADMPGFPGRPADAGDGAKATDCQISNQQSWLNEEKQEYYDKPVAVVIPWELEPLPEKLKNNPMHLLYFHHFLDSTAKDFVPFHDPASNPFSTSLLQMALQDDVLMSLVLAYSASHRARLLQTEVPEMRMAQWAQEIFPALRSNLEQVGQPVSNATLATAMMLASLEIVSPEAFGYGIAWRKHLGLTRDLVKRRVADMKNQGPWSTEQGDCRFLWSWFAYLDVMGRLGHVSQGGDTSSTWLCELSNILVDDLDEIDFVLGFTMKCAHLLSHVADLAHRCEKERLGPDRQVLPGWVPHPRTVELALSLERQLMESMELRARPCRHIRASNIPLRTFAEMDATNEAFHWAGVIHLHRRVLGKSSENADVQASVRRMIQCLDSIRWGSSAEKTLLFPMFTAGCNAADETTRKTILARFRSAEGTGMAQVGRARRLMERVWEEGQPWESLLQDEFIG